MYFPYLRGKQEEQFAVLESNINIYSSNKVLPIFEPCNVSDANMKRYKKMADKEIPFIFIINPQVKTSPSIREVISAIENYLSGYNNFHVGFIINNTSRQTDIERFLDLFPDLNKVIIHQSEYPNPSFFTPFDTTILYHVFQENKVSQAYIDSFTSIQKVILIDGFNKEARNSDYGIDDYFSNIHSTYLSAGYIGFGDYQTVGNHFSSTGGGGAYVVAIHLTYDDGFEIRVAHFLSTSNSDSISNQALKFIEALDSLFQDYTAYPTKYFNSNGIQRFRDLHTRRHFAGLGHVKRLSIIHHLEFIHHTELLYAH